MRAATCWPLKFWSTFSLGIVYPLATLAQCQGKTQAFALGWSDRFTNSSCKYVDHMTGLLRKCFVNSCATMSKETRKRSNGHRKERVPNRQTSRLGNVCYKGLRPPLIIMPSCSPMSRTDCIRSWVRRGLPVRFTMIFSQLSVCVTVAECRFLPADRIVDCADYELSAQPPD